MAQPIQVLGPDDVTLGCESTDMESAIRLVGAQLVERGAVDPGYVDGMLQREKTVSTYLGNGVALPHGVLDSKPYIRHTAIAIAQFPGGVDWGAGTAHLVVGLAATGEDHVAVLSQLAEVLQEEELCEQMWITDDADFIVDRLTAEPDEEQDED